MYGQNFPTLHDIFWRDYKICWWPMAFIHIHLASQLATGGCYHSYEIEITLPDHTSYELHVNYSKTVPCSRMIQRNFIWILFAIRAKFIWNSNEPPMIFLSNIRQILFYCCKRFISILLELPIKLLGYSFELHMKFRLISHAILGTCYYYDFRMKFVCVSLQFHMKSCDDHRNFLSISCFYSCFIYYLCFTLFPSQMILQLYVRSI